MTNSRNKKSNQKRRKKKVSANSIMKKKLAWVFAVTTLALCILTLVVAVKAMSTNEEYSKKALSQLNYSSTTIIAKSGEIKDANGNVLALSEAVYLLILDPKVILETENKYEGTLTATVEGLAEVIGYQSLEEKSELCANLTNAINENSTKSYLRYGGKTVLLEAQKKSFEEYQKKMNDPKQNEGTSRVKGVWFETEYRRYYPYGKAASKIIGFTTEDTSLGLGGLELSYNTQLRGTNGREYGYINEDSALERTVIPAQDGNTLITTIDMNMDRLVREAIDEWLQEYSAKRYAIMGMDPNTGAIKFMITNTDYDLNSPYDLSDFFTEEELTAMTKKETEDSRNEVWRNFITSDTFEPGSTAKMMTFAAALEEGTLHADDQFFCSGHIDVNGVTIRCHNQIYGGCEDINAVEAVAESCNPAFVQIGESLGRTEFARYQQIFNFGQKTGIDLPGEASAEGLLHTEENLNPVELATCAFGQGYNVTMIQLASAFCSLINGGNYYQPYVVSKIVDSNGNIVSTTEPTLVRKTVSEETCQIVKESLALTATDGTAKGIEYYDYHLGIKTGTAEKIPRGTGEYLLSTISAAPIANPKLVIYVVVDEPDVENQADSYPAQMLTKAVWGKLFDYVGVYSDTDPGPEQYVPENTGDKDLSDSDSYPNGIIDDETAGLPPAGESEETSADVSAGEQGEIPTDASIEDPTDVPVDVPTDAPADSAAETSAETPVEPQP